MTIIDKLKFGYKNNDKVVENYFFMTALQLFSSAFSILIYPYLIRVLGSESYGTYVFAFAVVNYFLGFISFGFHFPSLKIISQNTDDIVVKSKTVSAIFTAKILISILASVIFVILLFAVPIMQSNKLLFCIIFGQVISEILYPAWFYQAIQKMAIVTYYQLFFRIASLPFIFIFIKTPNDINIYAIVATLSTVLPSIGLFLYLLFKEKIRISLIPVNQLKIFFTDAFPFLGSDITGIVKHESVTVIIGTFFSMHDVALYDLANKIIIIPRMITRNINMAIFPKIINNLKTETIKYLIRIEYYIGLSVVVFISLFGYWITLFLGGKDMIDAFPLAIILSFTVIVWLVVGCYINFVFIPQKKYYYVTKNQLVALFSFLIIGIPAILLTNSIIAIVSALTISGFSEILYCKYLIKKHNML